MIAGICKETYPGERRVALIPAALPALAAAGHETVIQAGAGLSAGFPDAEYEVKGARILPAREDVFAASDALLQVRALGANSDAGRHDLDLLRPGRVVIGLHDPLAAPRAALELARRGTVAFAIDLMPRIARAQSMDALSSMATISGYKAVLLAAGALPRIFPMLMTAAGTVAPAKVFVVGAGVAGLQAVATAHRLGAVVRAYDVRSAVKEQVESLGARFVDLGLEAPEAETAEGYARAMDEEFYRRQRDVMARVIADSNVVITTAAVPGEKAPILVTADMVVAMQPGSVILDLAADRGGNCELTRPGEAVVESGVTILSPLNLPSTVSYHSSQMYSRNVSTFFLYLYKDGALALDPGDDIIRETLIAKDGDVVHPRIRALLGLPPREPRGEEKA